MIYSWIYIKMDHFYPYHLYIELQSYGCMSILITVMQNNPIDHQVNIDTLLSLDLNTLELDPRLKRELHNNCFESTLSLVLLLLNNSNQQLSRLIRDIDLYKTSMRSIRKYFGRLIDANGMRSIDNRPNYYQLPRLLTRTGLQQYFTAGGTIPPDYRNNRIWLAPSAEVIDALEQEILQKDSPFEMVYSLVTNINRHLNFPTKYETISQKVMTKHLRRLDAYQYRVGGFKWIDMEQHRLDLFWVFKRQKHFVDGAPKELHHTFEQLKYLLPKLIFPSRSYITSMEEGYSG